MVTPDIHWSVHLDLVTGPPETTDDDEIQCLGRMLLNSLEDHFDEAVGDAIGAKNPCSSPCGTTPLLLC